MIRLVTQFDPPGTQAVDAAMPGGCCSCCCCCCLATTISVSAVAAIQASRKARVATPTPADATLWVFLAAAAMVTAAIAAGLIGYAMSGLAQPSSPLVPIVIGLAMLASWGTVLWAAFRGVGFAHPARRAAAFVLIGVIAFGIEGFLAFYIILVFFPAYFLLVATVVGGATWMVTRPRVGPATGDNAPPP